MASDSSRGVRIRDCGEDDFESVLVLLRQLWPELELDPVALKEIYRECLTRDTCHALCAVAGGGVVGFCDFTLKQSLWHRGKLAYVDELIVKEGMRGMGIGTMLLERATGMAEDLGCRHIGLDSAFQRGEAHRFYDDRGFKGLGYIFGKDIGK